MENATPGPFPGFNNYSNADILIAINAPTWIQQLLETVRAKDEHIRALRIAKEHEIDCHTKSCLEHSHIANKPIGLFGEGFGWEEHYRWLKDDVRKLLKQLQY
ncbi:hypothetical protein LJK88_38345 [Paenibacillus sp. P26]|nr:hypothetical protein LJK88_38345 [Paenibacillus sp. P26]UUZ93210.1 hypothetical protein LJK87_49960 [Paenibacillus sp. P25]